MTYFNPLDKFFKSQIGAVCADKNITFRVKGNFDSVVFLLKKDGEDIDERIELKKSGDYFEFSHKFSAGLYYYCFQVSDGRFIGLSSDYLGMLTNTPIRFQLTVYCADYKVPKWLKGGVIYQIFPDRFNRVEDGTTVESNKIMHKNWDETPIFEPNEKGQVVNNDFFGGNLKGIIEKLDYLKSLSVSAIYLNPIFKAFSNHRYDTGNYMEIDPLLGTEEDFIHLIEKADERGIKIILDGVFNHTGDDSLYFNKYGNYSSIGAYQSKESKYYSWYNFENYPDKYDSWWGITVLPAVNENDVGYINYITGKNGVIDKYTRLGIGGWRLDVVDELPAHFVQKIRNATKEVNPDAIIIGEVWEDASNKISYGVRREYFQGKELDSVMNYPLKDAIINYVKTGQAKELLDVINQQIDHYPHDVLHSLMNILSTHDTYRLLSAVSNINVDGKTKRETSKIFAIGEVLEDAKLKLKIATLLQYTLYGVPTIYYGEEAGMQGYSDPLNRKTYPWGNEDKELLEWYRFLGRLRNSYSAFVDGEYKTIYCADGVLIFKRQDKCSELAVAVNLGKKDIELTFNGVLKDLISGNDYSEKLQIKSGSFAVLVKNS